METESVKIVIVGGVAGGASAAVRARRVNEFAKITIFEKGPYISFANCGLPYYVSREIEDEEDLILQTPENFKQRFNIDVFVNHEVTGIDRDRKVVMVKKLQPGGGVETFEEPYDKLILSPGAEAIKPPIPGLDANNVFTLKTVPDTVAIDAYIKEHGCRNAVVLGGGYIGIEAADALNKRGLKVTIVEKESQVMPMMDADIVGYLARHIVEQGINLAVHEEVMKIRTNEKYLGEKVVLKSGREIEADIIIASLGVKPNSTLAKEAGLDLGVRGAIKVNHWMETSDPSIYAVGDAAESCNMVTGKWGWVPLAGPANKEGRVAGTNAAGGNIPFKGVLGTSIVKFHELAIGKTGISEKEAKQEEIDYCVTSTHTPSHAGYYPGGDMVHLKLLVERSSGRILGGQAAGREGIDKRIDVLATTIYFGGIVEDLAQLDLAYAPQFGSAKDPVNISGMTAQNRFTGLEQSISLEEYLKNKDKYFLIDVRTPHENRQGCIEGSHLIPINVLRKNIDKLPKDKPIVTYCRVGYRGYLAQRILQQRGFEAYNLDGGYLVNENKEFDKYVMKSE